MSIDNIRLPKRELYTTVLSGRPLIIILLIHKTPDQEFTQRVEINYGKVSGMREAFRVERKSLVMMTLRSVASCNCVRVGKQEALLTISP